MRRVKSSRISGRLTLFHLGGGTDFAAAGAVEGGGQGQLPRLRFPQC
ncbi:MAG: hypothetical protein L6W00_15265 [Lentisphaeria bacterium]|nr:MAG: hypothetical protein L6W00_15265 [Lentisphaeria bacterium]